MNTVIRFAAINLRLNFIFLFFFMTVAGGLYPQGKRIKKNKKPDYPVELLRSSETEYLTFEQGKEGIIIFRGGVILKFQNNLLKAEVVKFNPNTGEIFGEGNVKWLYENKKLEGDSFIFNHEKQSGILFKGKMNIQPLYYEGDAFQQIKKDHYLVSVASFTTCDLENPHYSFKAKKVWIYSDNKLIALHVVYQVSDIPVFYWPLIFQTDLGTGIQTIYGNNQEKGHYVQNTYYFSFPFFNESTTGKAIDYILPEQGRVIFDYYQYTGELYGLFLNQRSKYINYDFGVQLANFRRRNTVCDPIFSEDPDLCSESTTNFFLNDEGAPINQNALWWNIDTRINARWVNGKNIHSNVNLEIKELRHRNFEPEFGNRLKAENSLDSIYFGPLFKNIGPQELNWRVEYNLNTQSTSFNLELKRTLRWNQLSTDLESQYLPSYDTLPRLSFSTRHQLIKPAKHIFGGSWFTWKVSGSIVRTLTEGVYDRAIYSGRTEIQNLYLFSFTRWIRLAPYLSYGLRYLTTTPQTEALNIESRRQSYHFLTAKTPLRLGDSSVYLSLEHEYQYFILRQFQDPTFISQGPHRVNALLKGDFYPYFYLTLDTRRDLREYPYPLDERFRWEPLKAFTSVQYDLLPKERSLSVLGKQFTFQVSLDNTYRYLIRFDRHGTNDTYFNLVFKNIDIGLIHSVNQIAFSLGWHHDFIDLRQNDLIFKSKFDFHILSDLQLIFETSSRVDQFERYSQGVDFFEDLAAGLNLFSDQNNNTNFNLELLRLTVAHQLHKWIFKIYYERYRRTIFWGGNLQNRASFYQQNVYIALTLTDFNFFQGTKAQVYRDNPGDNL